MEAAAAAFAAARRAKPEYWPAYSWWASYLVDHGKTKEARELANEGLKHAPQSRTLRLILEGLDSKEPKDAKNVRSERP